jgi:hypothetical protein
MLPTGFPAVIRDGVDALRWAGAALERALPRVPDWVAELAPSTEKAIAEAREIAKREGVLHVIAFRDANEWTQAFIDQQRALVELANRLERRTAPEWASGGAATYFTGLDLSLLQIHGVHEMLLQWLGEGADQIRRRKAELAALAQWLDKYLDTNA